MSADNAVAWDRYSASYQSAAQLSTDVVHYGPDIPSEDQLHLLGDLKGRRVLELGCGGAQCSIAFAKQGATAIGVDFSADQLAYARRLAEREEVRIELRQSDVADLAFLRADSVDLAFSAYAFGYVEDLNRVFRQVHRVLKEGAPLVFSLPHPAWSMTDENSPEPLLIRRSYYDQSPIEYERAGARFVEYHHSFEDIFSGLLRAGYRVDTVLEPAPLTVGPRSHHWHESFRHVPRTLIVRARKEGV